MTVAKQYSMRSGLKWHRFVKESLHQLPPEQMKVLMEMKIEDFFSKHFLGHALQGKWRAAALARGAATILLAIHGTWPDVRTLGEFCQRYRSEPSKLPAIDGFGVTSASLLLDSLQAFGVVLDYQPPPISVEDEAIRVAEEHVRQLGL